MKQSLQIVLILGVIGLFSCSKKEVPDPVSTLGLDYYPLQIGKYVIYQVDSTVYTDLPKDTVIYNYQLKEKISAQFEDPQGGVTYRLERFVRFSNASNNYEGQAWRKFDVWAIRPSNRLIELQENNLRFVRLIFPIQLNGSWDCNKTNTLAEQFCRYEAINETIKVNQLNLENTITVAQLNSVNLIEAHTASEKYGKGIGLVSKEYAHVQGKKVEAGKTVFERIENGLIYKQTILSHGVE